MKELIKLMSPKETSESWVSDITAWGVNHHEADLIINPLRMEFDLNTLVCIDVETDEQDNFVGIGFCDRAGRVWYTGSLESLRTIRFDCLWLCGHNIKSDAQWLRKWGIDIKPEQLVYDTMLASYVQDSTKPSHALKDLAKEILGYSYPAYKEIVGTGKNKVTLDKQPLELVANYCGMDVLSTFKLYQYFKKVLTGAQQDYLYEIEMPTMRALMLMEERGVTVDAAYLRTLDYKFNVEIQRVVESIKLRAPAIDNINSDKQVGDFLVSKGFTLPKTATGRNSVSVKSLEVYEGVPFVKSLRRYSELEKLTSTYTKPLIERGGDDANITTYRLHANFNQAITHTGRLSSSNPNLQNIPTRTETGNSLRRAFVAKPGHCFVDADYSQIEPRLFAHFSRDPELLHIFNTGLDLYDYVSLRIGSSRPVAKTVWLALSYNAGAFKIAQTAHISNSQAVMFVDKMKKQFKTAFDWKESVIRQADSDKYVETMFGSKKRLERPELAPNYKVQGSAAEIMKKAIINLPGHDMVLTVHDELLIEAKRFGDMSYYVNRVKQVMESVVKLSVPLIAEVGIGQSWQEAKESA